MTVAQFVDRRLNAKNKSAVNRQRFIQRYRSQIKRAVSRAITGRSITDIDSGETVNIPSKDISEPSFQHGGGGRREMIHPGNKEFVTGDRVPRPDGGGGKGGSGSGEASNRGEDVDDFVFQLSKEEFLEFFFDDLELPNLIKTQVARTAASVSVRAGYTSDGVPSNINIVRSMRGAMARRVALGSGHRARLAECKDELARLEGQGASDSAQARALREEIERLEARLRAIPFLDTIDLRYNNRIRQPRPSTQAVMFCLMDVSGSMDEFKKDLAKRFFILLYLFLSRNYERTDVVFIRHHTVATEVDEEAFFYSRETGGTVVSSALRLMAEIVKERYALSDWNIYGAQASDGDNWPEDSPLCREILVNDLLPSVQYYSYVEITPERHQGLWHEYRQVQKGCENFAMRQIYAPGDIYPVFRELFKKRSAAGSATA